MMRFARVGLFFVHRDPQLVDGERKRRARHVRRHDRLDAVRFEQPPDDVGLDLRRRSEDDGQTGHQRSPHVRRQSGSAASNALIDLQQDHRHVVVLIGAADEGLDLAHDPLAQLAGLQVSVLLDDAAETGLAEEIALGVHRLGDAVGVEDDHVSGRQIDALFLEQLGELLRGAVDAEARGPCRSASAPGPTASCADGPDRKISGVCPARQNVMTPACRSMTA